MDRHDEAKHHHQHDHDEHEADLRPGETLGLGGSVVPKAPGDPSTEYDEASVRRRRERMSGADEEGITQEDPDRQRSGATGIDMGSGGQGTHTSGK